MLRLSLALVCLVAVVPRARAEAIFHPTAQMTPATLSEVVRAHSAKSSAAQLTVDLALAEAVGARVFGNPIVDFTWGTIPLGEPNPKDLASPLANIPNYNVGVSYTFDFLRRPPRVRRADALVRASRAEREVILLEETWSLAKALGKIAVSALKRRASLEMRVDADRATEIARIRGKAGAGSLLDVDRMENERLRTELQVTAADAELEAARADCAAILGLACADFATPDDAEAFLHAWTDAALARTGSIEERADLQSLSAQVDAASAELGMAKRLAIPDVTVRLGYTRDQFVVSGNQQNSLNVGIALPLPVLSRGQAERRAATARAHWLADQRERLVRQSLALIPAQRRSLALGQERLRRLVGEMIPRARAVLASLQKASESRLLPITDVLQASRTLNEMLLDLAATEATSFETAVELLAQFPIARSDTP